jgi:hypothetical protein
LKFESALLARRLSTLPRLFQKAGGDAAANMADGDNGKTSRIVSQIGLSRLPPLCHRTAALRCFAVVGDMAHLNVGFWEQRMSLRDPKPTFALPLEQRRISAGHRSLKLTATPLPISA